MRALLVLIILFFGSAEIFADTVRERLLKVREAEQQEEQGEVMDSRRERGENKRSGVVETYYENGNLKSKVFYKNGKREGAALEYYENGNVEAIKSFKADKLDGISNWYYEDGGELWEGRFKEGRILDKNGKLKQGVVKSYHKNGNLRSEYYSIDGLFEGTAKYYSKDGKLIEVKQYKEGKIIDSKKIE